MNAWIMNLKDNKDEKPNDLTQSKFQLCLEKGILGIGWVGYEDDSDCESFQKAKSALYSFEVGDLVWTKDPDTGKRYLCEVLSKAEKTLDTTYNQYDIGHLCNCKYYAIENITLLLEGIDIDKPSARHTIEKADETLSSKSQYIFNKYFFKGESKSKSKSKNQSENKNNSEKKNKNEDKNKSEDKSESGFFKKHKKKLLITLGTVVAVVLLVILLAEPVIGSIVNKTSWNTVEGKCYYYGYQSSYDETFHYTFVMFQNGKASYLDLNKWSDGEFDVTGTKNFGVEFYDCKFGYYLEGNSVYLEIYDVDGNGDTALEYTDWNGIPDSFNEITWEECMLLIEKFACDHRFSEQVIEYPSCEREGRIRKTCRICGYSSEETTPKEKHNYYYGYCTKCGQKKPLDKSKYEPNTWYVANDLEALRFRNFELTNYAITGGGTSVTVNGHYFCAYCKVLDSYPSMHRVSFNYSVNKYYYCEHCNNYTTVKIELDQ